MNILDEVGKILDRAGFTGEKAPDQTGVPEYVAQFEASYKEIAAAFVAEGCPEHVALLLARNMILFSIRSGPLDGESK